MDNPWLSRQVIAFAHQGGAREVPSSTLFAIEHALSVGATAIELDVHQSLDGSLVVSHDSVVDRTTNGTGAIAAMTERDLAALDNAYYFVPGLDAIAGRPAQEYVFRGRAPEDGRFRIATLDEVLEITRSVVVNLDIKQTAPVVPAYEEHLADTLVEHGRTNDVIVGSFNDRSTEVFSRFAPAVATSPGTTALTMFIQALRSGAPIDRSICRHAVLQVPLRIGGIDLVDERFVGTAHELGLAVHVWTVDDEADMARLVALGVDGIITNVPSLLSEVLERLGATWRH